MSETFRLAHFLVYTDIYIKKLYIMQVIIKKNNKLVKLGEGRIYSKSQLKLNELNGLDANLTAGNVPVNGIQQAQIRAKQLMNKNAGVTSA